MKTKNIKGFSIIELSISLTIIGIVILFTMSSLQTIGENVAATKTETKMDGLISSVINNVSGATSGATVGSSGVRDLRLPNKDDMKNLFFEIDGYGNTFDYIPSDLLLDSSSGTNLCTATKTGLKFQFKDFGASEYREMPLIAFLVVGKGANLKKDYDDTSANVIKLDRGAKADDVFRYVTLDELKLKVGCTVGRNDEFNIITTEIPPLQANTIGRIITTYPSNSPSSVPFMWCVGSRQTGALSKAINIATSFDHNDFTYPVKDNSARLLVTNCASSGDTELGKEVLMSRKVDAVPGTYKLSVEASYGESSIRGKSQKVFVVTVPF